MSENENGAKKLLIYRHSHK